MLAYVATDGCRMRFLREQLDDPEATDCGRCDNCGGADVPRDVSGEAVERAGSRLRAPASPWRRARCGPPRWPPGPRPQGPDRRRRRARPGRRAAHRPGARPGAAGAVLPRRDRRSVPPPLVDAVVEVLRDWARSGRPGRPASRTSSPPPPPRARPRPRHRPGAADAGCRWSPGGSSSTPTCPRARVRPTPPAGSPPSPAARAWPSTSRSTGAGPAGRRPRRHRLDPDRRRPRPARGRRLRRPPGHPRHRVLTRAGGRHGGRAGALAPVVEPTVASTARPGPWPRPARRRPVPGNAEGRRRGCVDGPGRATSGRPSRWSISRSTLRRGRKNAGMRQQATRMVATTKTNPKASAMSARPRGSARGSAAG